MFWESVLICPKKFIRVEKSNLQTKDEQKIPCKSRLQFQNSVFRKIRYSINLVQKCFIGVPLQRYIFSELLVKLFVEHTAVAHELSVVQVGVPFQGKLVLGEQRKHVDARQVVILRLLDGARNDTGRVVDKPIGLKGKSKNNNFHSCKQLFAKCCKKKFVKASGSIYEMPLAA